MSTCILVLGTPRSGTSCVAGVLHHLGVPMGERFPEPDEWNPAGYYQDEDFEDLIDLYDPVWKRPNRGTCVVPEDEVLSRIAKLIDVRNAQHEVWGLKSNRMAHFMPMLAAQTDLKVIRTSRTKAVSVASWRARSGNTIAESNRINTYIADIIGAAFAELKIEPALTVNFDALMSNPVAGVAEIAAVLGVEVTKPAVDWVQPNLVRFQNG